MDPCDLELVHNAEVYRTHVPDESLTQKPFAGILDGTNSSGR
jgi:hypothetical protein